jgi:hypothetical protein
MWLLNMASLTSPTLLLALMYLWIAWRLQDSAVSRCHTRWVCIGFAREPLTWIHFFP